MFFKIGVRKNFTNFTGKHLCWSLFLIKLQACNFLKKRLQHRDFPVKFVKFLKTSFFTDHLRWLLLLFLKEDTYKQEIKSQYYLPWHWVFMNAKFTNLSPKFRLHKIHVFPKNLNVFIKLHTSAQTESKLANVDHNLTGPYHY